MPIEPALPGHERGEAHPHVQSDATLLRQHVDRAERPYGREYAIEAGPHRRVGPDEVGVQVAQHSTGVGLVAIGEGAAISSAGPHRLRRIHEDKPHTSRGQTLNPPWDRSASLDHAPRWRARWLS